MPIEDVFSIQGRGTVVTGRVERGIVRTGEEVAIIGLKDTIKTTCTAWKCSANPGRRSCWRERRCAAAWYQA